MTIARPGASRWRRKFTRRPLSKERPCHCSHRRSVCSNPQMGSSPLWAHAALSLSNIVATDVRVSKRSLTLAQYSCSRRSASVCSKDSGLTSLAPDDSRFHLASSRGTACREPKTTMKPALISALCSVTRRMPWPISCCCSSLLPSLGALGALISCAKKATVFIFKS